MPRQKQTTKQKLTDLYWKMFEWRKASEIKRDKKKKQEVWKDYNFFDGQVFLLDGLINDVEKILEEHDDLH